MAACGEMKVHGARALYTWSLALIIQVDLVRADDEGWLMIKAAPLRYAGMSWGAPARGLHQAMRSGHGPAPRGPGAL